MMRKKAFIGALLFTFFSFPIAPVLAATMSFSETYTLPTGSKIDHNAYLAGGTVIISGPIGGDALVAGGNTTLSGPIGGDALVAAGSVDMLGSIAGDFRAVGGNVTIAEKVSGDVSLVAGFLSLLETSEVLGDALLVGGKLSLVGTVNGTVYLAGGDIFIDGKIGGNVKIFGAGNVHLGSHAVIAGDLTYRAPHEAVIDSGAVVTGKARFEYAPPLLSAPDVRGFFAGLIGALFITRLLVLVTATLFFVLVFRRASGAFMHQSGGTFWKHTLIGLAVFVSIPVASLVLALTVFGGVIAAAALAVWFLLLILAQVYAGVLAATVFRTQIMRRELDPLVSWQMAVLGALGINIVLLVPYIGLFVGLLFFLASLGSISFLGYKHFLVSR